MTIEYAIPPLRDLPPERLDEQWRGLLAAIEHPQPHRHPQRMRVAAVILPAALAAAAAGVVLSFGAGAASGTPTLPEPLAFTHGSHAQAAAILQHAAERRREAPPGAGSVRYAKTRNYALQTDVGQGAAKTYIETTIREVWVPPVGAAVAKSWLQDTTRAGMPIGPGGSPTTTPDWQDVNSGLPSDPAALETVLLRGPLGDQRDVILAQEAMAHLAAGTATPAQTASLYRVLASLPSVFDAGSLTDNAGRHGHAIGVPTGSFDAGRTCTPVRGQPSQSRLDARLARNGTLGHGTTYLVLDSRSGRPLEVETVLAPNAPCGLRLPRQPTVQEFHVLLQTGAVSRVGAVLLQAGS